METPVQRPRQAQQGHLHRTFASARAYTVMTVLYVTVSGWILSVNARRMKPLALSMSPE
jgi:hypothetical protein